MRRRRTNAKRSTVRQALAGAARAKRFRAPFGGGPKVVVSATAEAMSQAAASFVLRELRRQPNLLLCASAGGSPARAYELLVKHARLEPGAFRHLRVLKIDEWGGLDRGNPATCEAQLQRQLAQPLGLTPDRYVAFDSCPPDPEAESRRLAEWVAAHGPIGVCVLGLGTNGHLAMNEPARALRPFAHVARLAESSVQHPMMRHSSQRPGYGLTLGLAEILASRRILLLVSGRHKRSQLARLLEPEITPEFPASFLWLHPDVTILADRDAAGKGEPKGPASPELSVQPFSTSPLANLSHEQLS